MATDDDAAAGDDRPPAAVDDRRPPILGSWRNIYLLLLASLAALIALLSYGSAVYR